MSPVKSAGEGRRGENYRAEGQEVKRHGRKDERRQRNREGKKLQYSRSQSVVSGRELIYPEVLAVDGISAGIGCF